MKLNFYIDEIDDQYVRENFRRLLEDLTEENVLLSNFKHFEINLTAAVTDYDFAHNLGYVPLDVLTTFVTPGITLTWKYDKFTSTHIRFSTSGACRIRAFVGAYKKGKPV